MAIGPKGPPQKPGLSIRGRVIFDTVRGVPRVRQWPAQKPTTPGTPRHLTAKAFGAANRACKVTAAVFYGEHWAVTRGTPLLPRDLMIAFMYGRAFALTLDDGRIIRSMAARKDVSLSLDMISQTEGHTLRRGPKYWESVPPPQLSVDTARLWIDPTLTGQNHSGLAEIPFNNGQSTLVGAVDVATHPRTIIIPSTVNRARLTANIEASHVNSNATCVAVIFKNGGAAWSGVPIARWNTASINIAATLTSWIDDVTPGDEFSLALETSGDSSISINIWRTWLQAEMWE